MSAETRTIPVSSQSLEASAEFKDTPPMPVNSIPLIFIQNTSHIIRQIDMTSSSPNDENGPLELNSNLRIRLANNFHPVNFITEEDMLDFYRTHAGLLMPFGRAMRDMCRMRTFTYPDHNVPAYTMGTVFSHYAITDHLESNRLPLLDLDQVKNTRDVFLRNWLPKYQQYAEKDKDIIRSFLDWTEEVIPWGILQPDIDEGYGLMLSDFAQETQQRREDFCSQEAALSVAADQIAGDTHPSVYNSFFSGVVDGQRFYQDFFNNN